ncbi:hypothetical protein L484_025229 [Morus notabilis]|uniref:Uncharacterized protein n=1 Tax=Morus notabilis TaxID=981085 RepID=W9S4T7_9ROSA|nr:hypothetical protein L484_025229 [Morus notabilis]
MHAESVENVGDQPTSQLPMSTVMRNDMTSSKYGLWSWAENRYDSIYEEERQRDRRDSGLQRESQKTSFLLGHKSSDRGIARGVCRPPVVHSHARLGGQETFDFDYNRNCA